MGTVSRISLLHSLVVALLVALSWSASPSAAQGATSVLLVPLELNGAAPDTSAIADAASTTGTSLRSHESARATLLATLGDDSPEMTASDLESWVTSSRQAVRALSRADYDAARAALAQAEAVTDRALAELNREATRARQVLDTCLYLVRSLEETGQHGRAVEQGYACRRLVPRGAATTTLHPPEVRAILDEVDRALAEMPGARLRVTSEPSGCGVRLNGLEFGSTPLLTEDLRPGEYRVQVECEPGRRGRVHRVVLGRSGAELAVDGRTEASLRTQPLRIVGPASRTGSRSGTSFEGEFLRRVARIGQVAGASEVWVVEGGPRQTFALHRVDVASGRELALVHTSVNQLALALASLRQGRSHDWTDGTASAAEPAPPAASSAPPAPAPEPARSSTRPSRPSRPTARASDRTSGRTERPVAEAPAPPPEPAAPPAPTPVVVAAEPPAPVAPPPPVASSGGVRAEAVLGVVALVAGLGGSGVSWALAIDRHDRLGTRLAVAEPEDVDYLARQSAWLDAQTLVWAASGVSAAVTTVAIPLLLEDEDGVPAWSWLLGGVGAVGVGTGIALAVTTTTCPTSVELDQPCVDRALDRDLGWLVAAQAAPLLAFPITHLVRSATHASSVRAELSVAPDRASLTLGGAF